MVATTKQISMVDNVIDIVEGAACGVTVIQWPDFIIGGVKVAAEAAEQGGHGQFSFAVTIIPRQLRGQLPHHLSHGHRVQHKLL